MSRLVAATRMMLWHVRKGTYGDLSSTGISGGVGLVNLVQETDELVFGDSSANLAGLRHADEKVGNLACLLRFHQSDPRHCESHPRCCMWFYIWRS